MTQLSEFQALKALIHTNLDRYEDLLKKSNIPEPFLNEPRLHPTLDVGDGVADKELYVTTRNLTSALDMMATMLQLPSEHLMSEGMSTYKALSLQMATSLNLADVIRDLGGEAGKPVSVDQIGERTGLHPTRVLKVLRPLANSYIFQETSEGYFVNNRLSLQLLDDCDAKSYIQYASWMQPRAIPHVPDVWLKDEVKDDFGPSNAAFLHAFGLQHKAQDAFELFGEHLPELGKRFGRGMQACNRGSVEGILLDYPWSSFPSGTTIVDIGGGIGGLTEALLQAFPNLSGVVQDRPEVVAQGKAKFLRTMPDAVASGRVQFDAGDFFQEVTRSGPKTVFVMRMIIHDWPDEECLKILRNVKAKMQSDSKLIILDTLVQPAVVAGSKEENDELVEQVGEVPYPLCKSGGVTGNWIQRVDQEVNVALNATERTATDFKKLIERAGLKVEGFLQPRSRHGVITAVLP